VNRRSGRGPLSTGAAPRYSCVAMAVTTASASASRTATTPVPAAAVPAAAVAPAAGVVPAAAFLPGPAIPATAERGRRRGRSRRVAALLLLAGLLAIDLARPPASQASARLLLGGIHLYQATLSPHMASLGVRCRFRPTCSHYAAGAIARYGALSGSLRAAWRLVRCGPWTPLGTYDPP
jgi:uncharacterized protein